MKTKVFAVIDTNVLISATLSHGNAPFSILQKIDEGNIIPVFDKRMLCEYYEVFHYPKFKDKISEDVFHALFVKIMKSGILLNDVEQTKIMLADQDDIPFFEVKCSSPELDTLLVTGNLKHYPDDPYIVSPKELLVLMHQMDRFLQRDYDYGSMIEQLMRTNLATSKYSRGENLLEQHEVETDDYERE